MAKPPATQCILVADFVPLANKGEEAIVRGIQDMLQDERPLRIGLFDDVERVTHRDALVIFPRQWLFRLMGGPASTARQRSLHSVWLSLQLRLGYFGRLRNLIASTDPQMKELGEFFKQTECVIVGHDGVFNVESAALIHLAKKAGKRVGILGSGSGIGRLGRYYQGWIFSRAIEESDFCYFRERYTLETMKMLHTEEDKLELAPDPAFAMKPADSATVSEIFARHPALAAARAAGRPMVSVTVLEKGLVYLYAFRHEPPGEKRERHARFVAQMLDELIRERNAFVLFLPHSIERDASDVVAARHAAEAISASDENYYILDEDLSARELKGIIRDTDFLLGERTHSLIGSVAVGAPFLGLTTSPDLRTHGIIGEMCGQQERLLDLDAPDVEEAKRLALKLFDRREADRESIAATGQDLLEQLNQAAQVIKQA